MKLMTAELKKKLPKLYSTEDVPADQKMVHAKFFDPCGRGTWYITEFDGKDLLFGFAVSPLGPDCDEWGYISLAELSAAHNRFGLGIERDLYWTPKAFGEIER